MGRLLLYDALGLRFRELKLRKNPHCVLCSAHATQKELIDYAAFCGVPGTAEGTPGVPEISPEALRDALQGPDAPLLVDVRDPPEWEISRLPGALRIPKAELPERVDELTRARAVVLYCRSGRRSADAARLLLDLGFQNVRSLKGGINAWSERVDPTVVRY